MKNVKPGTNFANDAHDYILFSFADELNTVIFGDEVRIARIWKTQNRVYSDTEKALIDKCEDESPDIPHSNLKKMLYGHPKHNGSSSFCKSAEDHLKEQVGNRTLSRHNGNPVDESSIDGVNAYIDYLGNEKRVSEREKG